jgi:hypothetical protein
MNCFVERQLTAKNALHDNSMLFALTGLSASQADDAITILVDVSTSASGSRQHGAPLGAEANPSVISQPARMSFSRTTLDEIAPVNLLAALLTEQFRDLIVRDSPHLGLPRNSSIIEYAMSLAALSGLLSRPGMSGNSQYWPCRAGLALVAALTGPLSAA